MNNHNNYIEKLFNLGNKVVLITGATGQLGHEICMAYYNTGSKVIGADYGIKVNCVSPGGIFNPEEPQGEDFVKNYSYRNPMGRMANIGEVIGAILYLSSEAVSYITGQNIVVDGGMSSW